MAKYFVIPDHCMGSGEIRELLGITQTQLSHIRNAPGSTMPLPIEGDNKYFLYDRKAMQEWIDEQLIVRQQSGKKSGLDNELAQSVIRRQYIG
jgi:hypothetical protein